MPATVAALVVSGSRRSAAHGLATLKPSPAPSASRASDSAVAIAAPARTPGQEMAERGAVSFSTITVSMTCITPVRASLFLSAGALAGHLLALLAGLRQADGDRLLAALHLAAFAAAQGALLAP